jgi:23S rRNA (uracil1939-C5)-methyltransferase
MRRKARRGGGRQIEVTIDALGGRGDGVAAYEGKPVFVPFALPGETARVRLTGQRAGGYKAEVLEILDAAPERVEAPCPHFGPCGGCTVQHLDAGAYRRWKQDQVVQALNRRGFDEPPVAEMVEVGEGTRRRAALAAVREGRRVRLGFHGRESHRIENIEECRILTPRLVALLDPLRAALAKILDEAEAAEVALLESESGIDLLLQTRQPLGLTARQALASLAEREDLARIAWAPAGPEGAAAEAEPVAMRRPPLLTFGGVSVEPPPGAFVQPTVAGEAALVEAVSGWLADVEGPVADYFAGCGTFALPLSRRGPVHAVEGAETAIAALWQAARKNDLAGRMTAETRDLAKDPPTPEELDAFAAVVFDPPRVGAKELAKALADSNVPVVAAVSCNAHTFARDARTLVDGGYTLAEVRPIDQFPWSGHVELAALFRR